MQKNHEHKTTIKKSINYLSSSCRCKINTKPLFEISVGPTDEGWCDFSVTLGEYQASCNASCIGGYPLSEFIEAALALYTDKEAHYNILVEDEPGGIHFLLIRQGNSVEVRVYDLNNGGEAYCPYPYPMKHPDRPPDTICVLDFWQFAEEVYRVANRAIAAQGFSGINIGWAMRPTAECDTDAIPFNITKFFFLAALIKHRKPNYTLSLDEEIAILQLAKK